MSVGVDYTLLAAAYVNEIIDNKFAQSFIIDRELINKLKMNIYTDVSEKLDKVIAFESKKNSFLSDVCFDSQDKIMEFFKSKYPMLSITLDKRIIQMFKFQLEIVNYYNNDRISIFDKFKKNYGEITNVTCNLGDIHNGKSVSKVTLENGVLYFKPRNIRDVEFFNLIVDIISPSLKLDIKKYLCLERNGYSWIENIEYSPLVMENKIDNYYYRSGCLLGIFFILGSYDMHYENIICNGEYPIIIDYETIIRAKTTDIVESTEFKHLAESVLNTSFLPYINSYSLFDTNISGLLSDTDHISMIDEKEHGIIKNILFVNETNAMEFVGLEDVSKALKEGFSDASLSILKNKEIVIESIEQFFNKNEDMRLRQLLRPTQVYHQFVEATFHPKVLSSKFEYNSLFEIFENNFKPSKHGYLRMFEEVEQMKKGDIPYFYAKMKSKDLFSRSGVVCKDYYVESPIDSVKRKIEALSINLIKYQCNLIDMSIATKINAEHFGKTNVIKEPHCNEKFKKTEVIKIVDTYLESLIQRECKIDNSRSTIFMNDISEKNSLLKVEEMSSILYSGSGIILLFAYFGHIINNVKYLFFSKKLFNFCIININNEKQKSDFSVYTGVDGLAYISYNLFKLTNDIDYSNYFDDYLKKFKVRLEKRVDNIIHSDYLNGLGSIITFLSRVHKDTDNEIWKIEIKEIITEFHSNLVYTSEVDVTETIGLAHGLSGRAIALAASYSILECEPILEEIKILIELEDDIVTNKRDSVDNSWCAGTTGIILAREIIKDFIKSNTQDINLLSYLDNARKSFTEDDLITSNNYCLCHGIYGNISILHRLNKTPSFDRYKDDIFKKRFQEINDLSWFNKYSYTFESFMLGNSGVAYSLLMMFYDIPCVLSLDIYQSTKELDIYENKTTEADNK